MICAALLVCVVAMQDPDPFKIESGVYILRIAEQEMGEETVTFKANGWVAKGTYDILNVKKGRYEATLAGREWTLTLDDKRGEQQFAATLGEKKVTARKLPKGVEKSVDIDGPVVPYVDLVWVHFVEIGRQLVKNPKPGTTITAVLPIVPVTFPIKLTEVGQVSYRTHTLWSFTVGLASVEVILICAPDGLPLRILVPTQQVDVVLKGFEAVEPPVRKGVSIVDSGEWRNLLSKPKHDVVVENKVMIPMRDGVKLAADIYRPKEGRGPAILVRTPYSRVGEGLFKGSFYARRGYSLVAQDVRGRFDSEGKWFPFRYETEDGSDTIDWLAKQPWCDGNVGMIGGSYVGVVQWYAARSGNPHLKAIVPEVSPPDPDQNFPYEGGVFMLAAAWWARVLEGMSADEDLQKFDWIGKLATLPLNELDTAMGFKHPFIDEWLEHPPVDAAYWDPLRYQTHFGQMDVAALHISGWYDGDQPGAMQNFPGMRRGAKTEAARKAQYLIMGPWGHAFNVARKLGDVDFGSEAVIDLDSVTLRFFDRYLKGVDNGIDREDPVYLFVMGANTWRREKEWPLPDMRATKLHLAGGKANRRDGGGRLALAPSGEPDEYRYDPKETPESMVDFNDFVGTSATMDVSKLPDRDDVLDYTSAPLAESVDLVGPMSATLWVSTDGEDTDFLVEILRLGPDGKLRGIMGGIQRVRYRNGKDEPVKPKQVVSVTVDCWASGVRLEKGDRIRVLVSSNAFPGYARNMNTLEPQATAKAPRVALNRVYHDLERPSHVLLPLVHGELRFQSRP